MLLVAVPAGWLAPLDAFSRPAVAAALDAGGATRVAQVVEHATQPAVSYGLALVVVVVVALRGRRRAAGAALGAGVVAAVASPVLKVLVGRERPALEAGLTGAGGGSFPSGHALSSATVVLGLLVLLLPPARTTARAVLRWVAGLAVVVLVGVDRVWLGAHWPTDVLAGWSLAVLVVGTAAAWAWRPSAHRRTST